MSAAILAAGTGLAMAGGSTPAPAPKITAATVLADKTKITTDTAALNKDKSALVTQQSKITTDIAVRASNDTKINANDATISTLTKNLSTALGTHDYATATKVQQQLATLRAASAKLQADSIRLNGVIKADQAAINAANERIILDTRQLKLDTDHYNADQYYLAISGF